MPIRKRVPCLSLVAIVLACAAPLSARCPLLQSTDRVEGIDVVLKPCIREAKKGDAAASWTLAVVSRYMVCDETTESRKIARGWQEVAQKLGSPDAIFESAMFELYSLGSSIEEEDIESIRDVVKKLHLSARMGQPDAYFQLYRLHGTFRYTDPPIAELGSFVNAVDHLLRAVDLGSYMAAEELAATYLSANDAQEGRSNEPNSMRGNSQYDALINELHRRGALPSNLAEAAELNLTRASLAGRWEAMEKLEDGYERGTFGRVDSVRALAWMIVRRLDGDPSAKIPKIEQTSVTSLCEQLQGITRRSRIFEYHGPDWHALASSDAFPKDCIVTPILPKGNVCLHTNQLVEP